MYKLSDVAKKLNIEKILIFEMLLTKGEYLKGNIEKKSGVTYLSDDGVEIIRKIINGENLGEKFKYKDGELKEESKGDLNRVNHEEKIIDREPNSIEEDILETNKNVTEIDKSDFLDENLGKKINDTILNKTQETIEYKKNHFIDRAIEYDSSSETEKLKELTEKSKIQKYEKEKKKNLISQLRNEFIVIDSEIRKKQEALDSYDKILEEDIKWLCVLEDKLSEKMRESKKNDVETQQKKIREKIFFKK